MIATLHGLKLKGGRDHLNLANVLWLCQNWSEEQNGLDDLIANFAPEFAFRQYHGMRQQNPKMVSSYLAIAQQAQEMLSDPAIANLTASSEINLRAMRKKKTALFVIAPSQKISMYAFLLNLLYIQAFNAWMNELPAKSDLPIFCLLDEF